MEKNNKLREALKSIWKEVYFYAIEDDKQDFAHLHESMLENPPEYKDLRNSFFAIAHLVDAALAEPVRNCDVGTADEQAARMRAFCAKNGLCHDGAYRCENCGLIHEFRCELAWAQMPYEAEKGGTI